MEENSDDRDVLGWWASKGELDLWKFQAEEQLDPRDEEKANRKSRMLSIPSVEHFFQFNFETFLLSTGLQIPLIPFFRSRFFFHRLFVKKSHVTTSKERKESTLLLHRREIIPKVIKLLFMRHLWLIFYSSSRRFLSRDGIFPTAENTSVEFQCPIPR